MSVPPTECSLGKPGGEKRRGAEQQPEGEVGSHRSLPQQGNLDWKCRFVSGEHRGGMDEMSQGDNRGGTVKVRAEPWEHRDKDGSWEKGGFSASGVRGPGEGPRILPGPWTVQVEWSGECCEHGSGAEKRSPERGRCLVQERGTLADFFVYYFIMNLSNLFTVEKKLMNSHTVSPPAPSHQHTPVLFNLLFLSSLPSLAIGTQISGILSFQS